MAEPYKREIALGNIRITSVVMDQADFDTLCDDIEKPRCPE